MQPSPALNSLTQDTSEGLPLKLGSQQVLGSSPHWPLLIHHSQNRKEAPVNKRHTALTPDQKSLWQTELSCGLDHQKTKQNKNKTKHTLSELRYISHIGQNQPSNPPMRRKGLWLSIDGQPTYICTCSMYYCLPATHWFYFILPDW